MGLPKEITYSFLSQGHTKFSGDWGFGIAKNKYKTANVATIKELSEMNESSSFVNKSFATGDEKGNITCPVYDWHTFFYETCGEALPRKFPRITNIIISSLATLTQVLLFVEHHWMILIPN